MDHRVDVTFGERVRGTATGLYFFEMGYRTLTF